MHCLQTIHLYRSALKIMPTETIHPLVRYTSLLLCAILLASCREPAPQTANKPIRYDIATKGLLHDAASNSIYLWSDNAGINRLTQNNGKWSALNKGLKSSSIATLAVAPNNPALLYTGGFGTGIYRSTDSGRTWIHILKGLSNSSVNSIALDPAKPGTLYISTLHGGVFASTDGGNHWNAYSDGLSGMAESDTYEIVLMSATPDRPTTLLLANSVGLYKRSIQDPAWTPIGRFSGQNIIDIAYDAADNSVYVVAGYDGVIYKGANGGEQWHALPTPLPQRVSTISVQPQGRVIYAGLLTEGVMKSVDQGQTWIASNKDLPQHTEIAAIVVDKTQPQRLYVGFRGRGVYGSNDGGASWRSLNSGFPVKNDVDLSFLSQPTAAQSINPNLPIPKEFRACNVCHGWADPKLNALPGRMLVVGTPRDWSYTVHRMNAQYQYVGEPLRDSLRPWEEAIVIQFLNQYYGPP